MKPNPWREEPIEIEVSFVRPKGGSSPSHIARCRYRLTEKVHRERFAAAAGAEDTLKAALAAFRAGWPGRPFVATIVATGAVVRGCVPERRSKRVERPKAMRDLLAGVA